MDNYLDSCVIISAVLQDSNSQKVNIWLADNLDGQLTTSAWSFSEVASALGLMVRKGIIMPNIADQKWLEIQIWLNEEFHIENIAREDLHKSANNMTAWSTDLRAGDALHLAVAARTHAMMVTTDNALERACIQYNVPVQNPNRIN